jgi:hypothetical protein
MRNLNNEFWNYVRFLQSDEEFQRNYYEHENEISVINGVWKDFWRVLIPSSDLNGYLPERCEVVLIKPSWVQALSGGKRKITFPTVADAVPIGKIRRQRCEYYCEFELLVNTLPDGKIHKQFSLTRSNGKGVFRTFRSQKTELNEFMIDLSNHFERNGFAGTICEVEGNVLRVKAYTSARFYLSEEACTIGIGKVEYFNENSPQIEIRKLATVTNPAKYRFDLVVDNIATGNILKLGAKSITVDSSTTITDIRTALLSKKEFYEILQTENVLKGSELGSYDVVNDIKPTVEDLYNQTTGGKDWYVIKVSGEIAEGNVIQVISAGRTPITKTVTATDTIASLMTLFNPDSGTIAGTFFYKVNQGIAVTVNVFEGRKSVLNTNALVFSVTNRVAVNAQIVDRYQCYITDDVVLRNEYYLQGKSYTAKKGDTALSVAVGLGQEKRQFIYEVPTLQQFTAYAEKGNKYGAENITDITLLTQPKVRKSNQYVCEFTMPSVYVGPFEEPYQLAIYNNQEEVLVALGNFIDFNQPVKDSLIAEFGEKENAYGFEYFEEGLTQIMRVPLMLKNQKHTKEENKTNNIDGGFRREETNLMQYRDFVSQTMTNGAIKSFQTLLNHEFIGINGKAWFCDGEINEGYPDEFYGQGQIAGKLIRQGKMTNSGRFTDNYNLQGYGTVTVEGFEYSNRVVLMDGKTHYIVGDNSKIPCAEYLIMVDNYQREMGCLVYVNNLLSFKAIIPENARTKIRELVRLNVDGNIRLVFVETDHKTFVTNAINEQAYLVEPIVTKYLPETNEESINDYFDHVDFNKDFL